MYREKSSATLTIYIDQPKPGLSDAYRLALPWPDVGHTFISISQGGNVSVLGFYPSGIAGPFNPEDPSVLGNDQNHKFDVSVSIKISSTVLTQILDYIKNYPVTYNLNNYNCTDFGIQIGNKAGLNLPDCYGTWPNGAGSNPGALGQYIRNMTLPIGAIRKTIGGTAPANNNGC